MALVDPPKKTQPEIDLFKKAKNAEEFLNLLPPDARPVYLPDGSMGFRDSTGKEYKVPPAISNEMRGIKSNVSDLTERTYLNTVGARNLGVIQEPDQSGSQVALSSGSDFLKNVGGLGATTFDYDLSDADLQEAIDLRKAAYGVDTIETRTVVNADGTEEKGFFEKVGDKVVEVFKSPQGVVTNVSPVSGKTITTRIPALEGTVNYALLTTPLAGLGTAMGEMGEKLVARQTEEVKRAALGQPFYGAGQVQHKATGQIVDLTTSPALTNPLANALGLTGGAAGTYAESTLEGPFIYNGREYATYSDVVQAVQGKVTPYGMERFIPAGETYSKERVVGAGLDRLGEYNEDRGEVDLGFGRRGAVTGVAIDQEGNLQYKTGTGGFFMGMGEMVRTGTGIGYSGGRADIAKGKDISFFEATDLLNKINDGTITSTPNTTQFLQNIVSYNPPEEDPDYNPTTISSPVGGYSGLEGYFDLNRDAVVETDIGSGVRYSGEGDYNPGYVFSETLDTDVYSEDYTNIPDFYNPPEEDPDYNPTTISSPVGVPAPDSFFDSSNESNEGSGETSVDSIDAYTAEGGRIGKQEGGTTVKPVSQIVQGAGFIAPQNNATEEQTIADDIPMEAEEGDFIINAPAAQFAGRQDIVTMIVGAIESLREKGVDIQYGNPKIPIKRRVQLAVSRNEVYVPKVVAEEIGYDKLEKINNRGKKEVEERQQEAQQQANRGGFVKKASGDVVEDKSSIIGTDEGNFLQDLGRIVIDKFGDKLKGFLSKDEKESIPEFLPEPRPEISKKEIESQDLQKQEKKLTPKEYEPQTEFQKLVYQALESVEKPKKNRNEAYIPDGYAVPEYKGTPFKNSGATIGLGVDLGQYSPTEWNAIDLNENLFNKIKHYILNGHLLKGTSGLATNKDKVHGSGGLKLLRGQPLILNDTELAELNSKIFNYKFNKFEKKHGSDYKDFNNPEDKAAAFVMDWGGAFKNPLTFKQVLKETLDTETALERGFINNKNIPSTGLIASRAKRLLGWYKKYRDSKNKNIEITPKPKPKEIQVNPDNRSFLAPSPSMV